MRWTYSISLAIKCNYKATYTLAQSRLENGAIFGRPFLSYTRMVCTELYQVAKDWYARDFGKTLDLGLIGCIQESPQEQDCEDASTDEELRHCA